MTERKMTYRGFRQFVRMQARKNPNRVINHNTWCGCALGEYLDGEQLGKEQRVCYWAENNMPRLVFELLNNCGFAELNLKTYHKLHKWLVETNV